MKKIIILLLGAFVLSGFFYVSGQKRTPKNLVSETVRIGLDRNYHLFAPENPDSKPMPLVFVFHGGVGTGLRMERWLKFTELAEPFAMRLKKIKLECVLDEPLEMVLPY